MVSLDYRTRTEASIRLVAVPAFFADELPALIAERGVLADVGARQLGVEPFTIATPSGTWTLALGDAGFTVQPGDDGVARVELADADVADVVNDLKTPMTFLTGGSLRMTRGNLGNFLDWWVVLRALIDGRPVHTRGALTFADRDGSPLDLARAFTPDDSDDDIAHFLAEAGFLHLRGWFDAGLMNEISADMDRVLLDVRARRRPVVVGEDGERRRPLRADGVLPRALGAVCELLTSERFLRIGRLIEGGYEAWSWATASRRS